MVRILDMRGQAMTEIRAPQDGLIGGYTEHLGVQAGQGVFTLWTPAEDLQVYLPGPAPL